MSLPAAVRLDPSPPTGIACRLRLWFDDLLSADQNTVESLLGHSLSFLSLHVPEGFVHGILSCWAPERHVFRFGTEELTPTLEEYARFTGLSLEGPCARVSAGHMRRQFLTFTGLCKAAILPVITSGHIIPIHFLIDRFSSSDSHARFCEDFTVPEERWRSLRVDVLMACVISFMYLPAGDDSLDVGVVMAVGALYNGHTIIPLILAETYISASYCRSLGDRTFRGSSILLYVWFMSHLRPIGQYRRQGFCFTHSLAMQFSFRPQSCIDAASWLAFFSVIEDPFSLLAYTGLCSFMTFLTHVPPLDFIPLPGLRGVTTYHPLAVMRQFDQTQEVRLFERASDFRFPISSHTERDLLKVYDLWFHKVSAEFSDGHPGQTPEYLSWLHGYPEMPYFDPTEVLDGSRMIPPDGPSLDMIIPLESADIVARSGVEGTQLRSARSTVEAERDIARAERDAALLARDTAIADRDAVILQVGAIVDAHSETIRQSAALLARIDMMGRQIAGGSETQDMSDALSLLLQLITDL